MRCAQQQRRVGAGEAAAEDERDVAARPLRLARHRHALADRVKRLERGYTRDEAFAQCMQSEHGIENAGRGDEMPEGPFECAWSAARSRRSAEDAANRERLRCIGLRRAVAVRRDHADVCRERVRRRRAQARSRAQARHRRRVSRAAPARRSPSRRREPRRGASRRAQRQRFPSRARSRRRLRRRDFHRGDDRTGGSFPREQSDVGVVEHHLRLDRRVVSHRERAVGLAVAQGLRRLDHRQRAADAVIGDARIRTLEAVADADVAEDVVGQACAAATSD